MKKVLLAVAALACIGSVALAGPNAGGTLIVHATPVTVYTSDIEDYCGLSDLTDCNGAITNLPGGGITSYVWWVTAAFAGTPRLAGIAFGVEYDIDGLVAWGSCGDFELADGNWPASGSGTALTFAPPKETALVDVYWFAGYEYYGLDKHFCLIPHPTQGAVFADDDVPSNLDPIADLGCLGFNGDPGYLGCPGISAEACCYDDGSCEMLLADECVANGGIPQGPGTVCDPNPCPPPPPVGACCFDTDCVLLTEADCVAQGGQFIGGDCDPNPCVIPVQDTSWGSIKAIYR
jgi:hypothetical protein